MVYVSDDTPDIQDKHTDYLGTSPDTQHGAAGGCRSVF